MRAEYKRGVVRPEVLGHAHKYGGQIQTQSKAIYIDRVSALHITQARPNTRLVLDTWSTKQTSCIN